MFKNNETYMVLGIAPQSIFPKLLIQRIVFQWFWVMLMCRYPFKVPQNRFIKELVPNMLDGMYLLERYDDNEFKNQVDKKEHTDRIQKRDLSTYRKNRDEDIEILKSGTP